MNISTLKKDPFVFGNAEAVIAELETLHRQVQLSDMLPQKEGDRSTILAWIRGDTDIKWIKKRHLKALYPNEVPLKDLDFASTPSPLTLSTRGDRGPTFLAYYLSQSSIRQFVLKSTDSREYFSNLIYDFFSAGFTVPDSNLFDLKTKIHFSVSKDTTALSEETTRKVQTIFTRIAASFKKEASPSSVLISKRVVGQNLLDLFQTKYHLFTQEQKEKFFTRLGRLAFLDLLLGNTDRLIMIDEGNLSSTLEANLGNLMVTNQGSLYAIDNSIEERYLSFLASFLKKENPLLPLAENIITSIKNALNSQIDDCPEKKGESVPNDSLFTIRQDLLSLATPYLIKGMQEMASWAPKKIVEFESSELALFLKQTSPDFFSTLTERLKVIS